MGLLNRTGYYNLNTFDHARQLEYFDNTMVWQMRRVIVEGEDNDYDYYYLEFKGANAFDMFPIESFMNPFYIEKIKNREIYLMVVNYHEGFMDIVEGIYNSLIMRDGIPAEQIILGTGNYDIPAEVKKIAELYDKPEIKVEIFMELEYAVREHRFIIEGSNETVQPETPLQLNTLEHKEYHKKFLCMNRRWRLHRPTMVALLECLDLLKYGHVSLGDADDHHDWTKIYNWMVQEHRDNPVLHNLLTLNKDKIFNIPELYLDTIDLVSNRAALENNYQNYLYNETYFSLITETFYYTDRKFNGGRYITEKTFKAIACEHPFILVTCPNSLQILKDLGYKTFHPFIDESYDQEYDDNKRYIKILDEVRRLCNLSPEQLSEFLFECKEITNHNLAVLRSKDNFVYRANW